jgi:hypothetical protein
MSSSDLDYFPESSENSEDDHEKIRKKRPKTKSDLKYTLNESSENSENEIEKVHDSISNATKNIFEISPEDQSRIYKEVTNAFKSMSEYVCAVCDNLVLANECSHKKLSEMSAFLEIMKKKLQFPDDLNELNRAFYDVSSKSESLRGIMLSHGGVRETDSNDCVITFCNSCESNIRKNSSENPPKFAIANGLWIGRLPPDFDDATKTEHAMMNLAQSNSFVTTVIGGYNRKLSSHAYSFRSKPTVPAAMLPRDILGSGEIKVGIAGALTSPQKMLLKRKYCVRIPCLKKIGDFYSKWNRLYTNVKFDFMNPELENVDSHIVQKIFDEHDLDERVEQLDQQPRHSEQKDDNSNERSSQTRVSVITEHEIGATLGVWRSNEILSDYKPEYWTQTFCELFPFGRGGLEEKRTVKIGLKCYLQNLLRLSSRRFASHESFPLVAFDVLCRHHAMSAIYLRTQVSPNIALNAFKVTKEKLAAQMKYQEDFREARRKKKPLPTQPNFCKDVFDLQTGIETGLKAYWGSNQERQKARVNVFSMCHLLGPPHIMFTINPDSSNSFQVLEYCGLDTSSFTYALNSSFPSQSERKQIVGNNPFASAKYFHTLMNIVIDFLFGWDRKNMRSKSSPGFFGFTKAFFGSVRICINAALSRACTAPTIGKRPMNSGIMPNFNKSSGRTCANSSPGFFSDFDVTVAWKPIPL